MAHSSATLKALPTRIDRYPAKMIAHLAKRLIGLYASDADHVLDPFCGSGAVLQAALAHNLRSTGVDINPFGVLLSGVKVEGFDKKRALDLCDDVLLAAHRGEEFPIKWEAKEYWFTPATIRKFEQIRMAAKARDLASSKAGRAVLLALGLSVRLCSRADQRSPKPFISKYARERRKGHHYDPAVVMRGLIGELCELYSGRRHTQGRVVRCDVTASGGIAGLDGECSHIVTSPPYINAQDYFRNSKLELYLLEGLLPFCVSELKNDFIGSERGLTSTVLHDEDSDDRRRRVPQLSYLERNCPGQAVIVHAYLHSMKTAFHGMRRALRSTGSLVIVCGDNLIGGKRILTWKILNQMLEDIGFELFDSFEDTIRNRAVAPRRSGHKGLIKQEVVSAFRVGR